MALIPLKKERKRCLQKYILKVSLRNTSMHSLLAKWCAHLIKIVELRRRDVMIIEYYFNCAMVYGLQHKLNK